VIARPEPETRQRTSQEIGEKVPLLIVGYIPAFIPMQLARGRYVDEQQDVEMRVPSVAERQPPVSHLPSSKMAHHTGPIVDLPAIPMSLEPAESFSLPIHESLQ
jgi:hypothetical protein